MKIQLTLEEFKKLANYRAASFDKYEDFDDKYSNDYNLMNYYNDILFDWIDKMDKSNKIDFILSDYDNFINKKNEIEIIELNYRDYYNVFSEPIKDKPKLKKNQKIKWIY